MSEKFGDDSEFERLVLLQSYDFTYDRTEMSFRDICEREKQLLLEAYENTKVGISEEEQRQSANIITNYDPIMWNLLIKYGKCDNYDYLNTLKNQIVALGTFKSQIEKDYKKIANNYQWFGFWYHHPDRKCDMFLREKFTRYWLVVLILGLVVYLLIWSMVWTLKSL